MRFLAFASASVLTSLAIGSGLFLLSATALLVSLLAVLLSDIEADTAR